MSENKKVILHLLRKSLFYYAVGISAACAAGALIGSLINYISTISFSASLVFFVVLALIVCVVSSTYLEYKFYKKWGKFSE